MTDSVPLICIPILEFGDWMAGPIYLHNVLAAFDALPVDERPYIFLLEPSPESVSQDPAPYRSHHCLAGGICYDATNGNYRLLWLRGHLKTKILSAGRPDWDAFAALIKGLTATFPVLDPLSRLPAPVYWIPDFQHHRLPDIFSRAEILARDLQFGAIATRPGRLVLSSQDARNDFARFYPKARIAPHVWSFVSNLDLSTTPFSDPRPEFGLPETFIYTPNQFWKHKGYETVIRALALLRRGGQDIVIVATGSTDDPRHPGFYDDMMARVQDLGLGDRFRHLGMLPRAAQISVYRAAAAVLQPSHFEGWSTVIEDVKSIGRPLVASDIPVHREQAPDGTAFFAVGDAEDLAATLARLKPDLKPGPDPQAEADAQTSMPLRLAACGRILRDILSRRPV